MAVTFKSKDNSGKLLLQIGIPEILVSKVLAAGWEVTSGVKSISFTRGESNKIVTLPVLIHHLVNNTAAPNIKSMAVGTVTSFIKSNVLAETIPGGKSIYPSPGDGLLSLDLLTSAPPLTSGSSVDKFLSGGGHSTYIKTDTAKVNLKVPEGFLNTLPADAYIKEPDKAKKISLKNASALYQPVNGTSADARYYVVALGDGFNVAARFVGQTKMSIRVEGTGMTNEVKEAFAKFGISDKGSYLSGHFSLTNSTPEKTLGAILMGSGQHYRSAMPNLTIVKGLPHVG